MEERDREKRFAKVFGIYLAVLITFVVVRLCAAFGLFSNLGDEVVVDAVSTAIIQIGIMLLLPFILYMAFFHQKPKQVFSDFKFKRIGIKALLICILLGLLGYIINLYSSTFFSIILNSLGYRYSGGGGVEYDTIPKLLFGVVSVALLPAICEEFTHRGLLLNGTRKLWGYKTAIIVSSIFFGLMHLNIQQFFFATILGIFMAYSNITAGSIYPSIIMHFMNNFINVLLSYLQTTGVLKFSLSSFITGLYSYSVVIFIIVVTAILFVCLVAFIGLIKLLHKTSIQNKKQENVVSDCAAEQTQTEVQVEPESINKSANPQTISEWAETYVAKNDTKKFKVPLLEKIPFILCLFLSILVTTFTFIWGVV